MHTRSLASALATALVLSACGDAVTPFEMGDGATGTTTDGLSLDIGSVRAAIGDTVRLRASTVASDGQRVRARVDWSVADPSVAIVEDGLVIPLAPGTTRVIASAGRRHASAALTSSGSNTVTPTSLGLPAEPVALAQGDSVQISANLAYSNGVEVKLRTSIKWTSLNPAVASVNKGLIKGKTVGTTQVVAQLQSMRDTVDVIVTAPEAVAEPEPEPQEPPPQDEPVIQPEPSRGPSELPRVQVDVSLPAVTGRTIHVGAGGDLQAAVDEAQPGDEIVLQPGVTYTGTLVLRDKKTTSTDWITIRTAGSLPSPGIRVTPAHAAQMPRLVAKYQSKSVIDTESGAHHYRLIGLEITAPASFTKGSALVSLGSGDTDENTVAKLPHHIILDRVYVHGHPDFDFRRCIALNAGEAAVIDSWISECHGEGADSQAIVGWNGTGPWLIQNNQLEGAGENVMIGGADSKAPELLPSDITVRGNHVFKPKSWKGSRWTIKNLFELKVGRRVLVEGNVFENNWAAAQTGFAILMKSVNQGGNAPWSQTVDVTFRYNVVRNVAHGVNLAGEPGVRPAIPAAKIAFAHNLFERVGSYGDYAGGRLFQVSGIQGLTIANNTGLAGAPILLYGQDKITDLVMTDNILGASTTVIKSASGQGSGTSAVEGHAAPGWIVRGNAFIGSSSSSHPAGNSYPKSVSLVGSILSTGEFQVSGSYTTIGADRATVAGHTMGAISY